MSTRCAESAVAFLATYTDLVWLLDDAQRQQLLGLTPVAFDDDRGTWALCLAQAYGFTGDGANVHKYAEQSRKAYEEQLLPAPNDAQRHRAGPRAGVPWSQRGGDPRG